MLNCGEPVPYVGLLPDIGTPGWLWALLDRLGLEGPGWQKGVSGNVTYQKMGGNQWPWVKIPELPPVNINQSNHKNRKPKMGGEFT